MAAFFVLNPSGPGRARLRRRTRCCRCCICTELSISDFGPALEQFLGSGAGRSADSISRLTTQWQQGAKTCQDRDLWPDFVCQRIDGTRLKVRLEQENCVC